MYVTFFSQFRYGWKPIFSRLRDQPIHYFSHSGQINLNRLKGGTIFSLNHLLVMKKRGSIVTWLAVHNRYYDDHFLAKWPAVLIRTTSARLPRVQFRPTSSKHRGKTSTHAPGWAFPVSFSVTLSSQIKVSRARSASFCV